jgi:rhodanese-related sulfurtransferase
VQSPHTGADAREGYQSTMSVLPVDLSGLRRLLDLGAQLVEVLPAHEYGEQHLPGAVNIPLKELDAARAGALDPSRPVVVYCWDGL